MRRALVTGATGMLGSYVVERLLADGWEVRGLVRQESHRGSVAALGAEGVVGDVTRLDSLWAAARDCDAVVHTAAAIGSGRDREAFHEVNVRGTANVIAAAEAASSRLVHVSTTWVFGRDRYFDAPTDERRPPARLPPADGYGRSKQEAEQLVLAAHAARRIWATLLRPPMMYGKRDRQFVPRLSVLLARGVFPLVAGGRQNTLSLVHAQAVADGAVRAARTDAAGGRLYHLTDDFPVTMADLVRYASLGLRRHIRTVPVPAGLARLLLGGLAGCLRLGGRHDLAPHAAGVFDMLTRDNPFTSARARQELGWSPTVRPAEGLAEAFAWWRQHRTAMGATSHGPSPAAPWCAPGS
jgi:2-alkyl-3-oxoalkanoate reductase